MAAISFRRWPGGRLWLVDMVTGRLRTAVTLLVFTYPEDELCVRSQIQHLKSDSQSGHLNMREIAALCG